MFMTCMQFDLKTSCAFQVSLILRTISGARSRIRIRYNPINHLPSLLLIIKTQLHRLTTVENNLNILNILNFVKYSDHKNSARPPGRCGEANGEREPDCEHAQVEQPGAPERAQVGWSGLESISRIIQGNAGVVGSDKGKGEEPGKCDGTPDRPCPGFRESGEN